MVILADILFILVLIGTAVSVFVFATNLTYPVTGFRAGFSEGYSMCKANTASLDYLPLSDAYCAYAPGDVLLTLRVWPPEVNDIACAIHPQYGQVCHRVYKVEGGKACFIGDNPRAKWTWCFGPDEYIGKVIGKLPRALGVPGMAYTVMRLTVEDFLTKVNSGGYPKGEVH